MKEELLLFYFLNSQDFLKYLGNITHGSYQVRVLLFSLMEPADSSSNLVIKYGFIGPFTLPAFWNLMNAKQCHISKRENHKKTFQQMHVLPYFTSGWVTHAKSYCIARNQWGEDEEVEHCSHLQFPSTDTISSIGKSEELVSLLGMENPERDPSV